MGKKTIYFNQKSLHRERQADTAKYAANFFNVISPLKEEVNNIKTSNMVPLYIKIISRIVQRIPVINLRKIDKISDEADFIYTRGDIPLFSKKPFIIELDNPYILTFYNYFAFKLYKPIITFFLRSEKCKKIVCISEACKKNFLDEVGKEFQHKTEILYPRMNDSDNKTKPTDNKIKFIFIGFEPVRKGCYELLEAFSLTKQTNIELNIIGFENKIIEEKYKKDKRIKFLGQIKRKIILDKYLPESNIFVLPTFHESFGIVALEALSHGLGIITTNVYALPELVKNNYNGIILEHPYLKENKFGFVDIVKIPIGKFYNKFLKNKPINQNLVKQIYNAIQIGISDHQKRQDNSKIMYKQKFSEKVREKRFLELFN